MIITHNIRGIVGIGDGATVGIAHQSADRITAIHRTRNVAIADDRCVVIPDKTADVTPACRAGNACPHQADVADCRQVRDAEKTDVARRPVDRQPGDRVAETIENTGKWCGEIADGIEAVAEIPCRCGRSGDVAAEDVVAVQVAVHALEIGSGDAAFTAQSGDNRIALLSAVVAELRAETSRGCEIDGRVYRVGRAIACRRGSLTIEQ